MTSTHPLLYYPPIVKEDINFHLSHPGNDKGFKNFDPTHSCRKCWERFNLKIKHPLPTPFTNVQTPLTPPTYLHLSIPSPFPTHLLCIKSRLPSPTYLIRSLTISTPHVSASRVTIGEHGGQTGGPVYGGQCVLGAVWCSFFIYFTFEDVCVVCGGVGRYFQGRAEEGSVR
ncbi:hypothetical protein PILCRDRAFT_567066 [Piloderma croceum F 1598]|uniref:Uncharacterized protein n=1 Tax=Piloderma croceum (strain F 1598) TaxID=765440 RepID=A0A0C3FH19_PILCF|nr:hypothetical protein PILCRDRAFT_567066 [Piloderma croceum F 1598]